MLPKREWLLKHFANTVATDMSQLNGSLTRTRSRNGKIEPLFPNPYKMLQKMIRICSQRKLQTYRNYSVGA